MTDEQIIKALECCMYGHECEGCPYIGEGLCSDKMKKDALDLINRQKAEIERLKAESQMADGYAEALVERTKVEAIKEFAKEIIHNILPKYLYGKEETALRIGFAISERANEMMEKSK